MSVKRHLLVVSLVSILGGKAAAATGDPSFALNWNCNGCHGPDGASVGQHIPSIAGMHPRYLFTVMRSYKLDDRYSTIMGRVAKGYSVAEIRSMAAYYSGKEWSNASVEVNDDQVAAGREVHEELCSECHENGGHYQDKEIPRLAGQWPEYLLQQMVDFRNPQLKMPQPEKMQRRMADLSQEELKALSVFYAKARSTLPPDTKLGNNATGTDPKSGIDH